MTTDLTILILDSSIACLIICFILIIWNDTNAFVEYARTFLGVKFEDYKIQESVGINYCDFLEIKYPDNFLVKLISCPICLTTWLSAGAAFYLENLLVFFLIFYLSLFFYFKFKKFMRESYE